MAGPDRSFWQQRFEAGTTPWQRGGASPQLAAWQSAGMFSGSVIVPGCGHGHEVPALAASAKHVIALDYAAAACALTRERVDAAGLGNVVVEEADVLHWQPNAPVDSVYEQTCLCALHPDQWIAYAAQLRQWLKPGGRLCGLFMQCRRDGAAEGLIEGPPYHLDINTVRALFPATQWEWQQPPYERVPHPGNLGYELAIVLTRR